MRKKQSFFLLPYLLWIILFVVAPMVLIVGYALTNSQGHFSLQNFALFFSKGTFIGMMLNSFWYALLITFFCLLISYPAALALSRLKNQQFWLMLVILPTWINLLLKAYAFIGIFSRDGMVNQFLHLFGLGPAEIMFTDFAFIFVATYIEIPFMIMPIYNSLKEIDPALISASSDLGANFWQTFRYVIWPLSWPGVESGIQAIFIPSLSLFMLTRLIGGNRVITLGTAVEEYFLTTMNWNMGSTIGVILIVLMTIVMVLTSRKQHKKEIKL